jgi:hypothetical protein
MERQPWCRSTRRGGGVNVLADVWARKARRVSFACGRHYLADDHLWGATSIPLVSSIDRLFPPSLPRHASLVGPVSRVHLYVFGTGRARRATLHGTRLGALRLVRSFLHRQPLQLKKVPSDFATSTTTRNHSPIPAAPNLHFQR